jgi:hypothetical protein
MVGEAAMRCSGFPLPAFALLALSTAAFETATAQSIRISGSTTVRYIELRPLVWDSISVDETEGSGLLRQALGGRIVRCVPAESFCHDTRPGAVVSTVPVTQDLEASAWGFGEGIRLFTHLRVRTVAGGGSDLWPRADDGLDLLAAYGEIDRSRYRLRAGRQWVVSGLGFYGFDGLALRVRPGADISLDGYAGRSLVRGLNESRTGGALEALDALAPEQPGLLFGAQAQWRPNARLAASVLYQIDVRDDRRDVYSELAAANGMLHLGRGVVEGALEADLGSGMLNEARLRVRAPPVRGVPLHAEVRRYRPYFELWTIWGAFSPVGFDEGRLGASRAVGGGALVVRAEASYRRYGATGTSSGHTEVREDGWGLGVNGSWVPRRGWRLDGGYRAEAGFGAARHDGQLGVARQVGEAGSLAVQALAFQRLYEFRLEEGTVLGLGSSASLRLSERARLFGTLAYYRHLGSGTTAGPDWSQRRGGLHLHWVLGSEPDLPRQSGGSR